MELAARTKTTTAIFVKFGSFPGTQDLKSNKNPDQSFGVLKAIFDLARLARAV
jgi:hypothetical protein